MAEKQAEITFHIQNIPCAGCAMDMENVLLDMNGVEEAILNYADGKFVIRYAPAEITAETITKKVKSLGFTVKLPTE